MTTCHIWTIWVNLCCCHASSRKAPNTKAQKHLRYGFDCSSAILELVCMLKSFPDISSPVVCQLSQDNRMTSYSFPLVLQPTEHHNELFSVSFQTMLEYLSLIYWKPTDLGQEEANPSHLEKHNGILHLSGSKYGHGSLHEASRKWRTSKGIFTFLFKEIAIYVDLSARLSKQNTPIGHSLPVLSQLDHVPITHPPIGHPLASQSLHFTAGLRVVNKGSLLQGMQIMFSMFCIKVCPCLSSYILCFTPCCFPLPRNSLLTIFLNLPHIPLGYSPSSIKPRSKHSPFCCSWVNVPHFSQHLYSSFHYKR